MGLEICWNAHVTTKLDEECPQQATVNYSQRLATLAPLSQIDEVDKSCRKRQDNVVNVPLNHSLNQNITIHLSWFSLYHSICNTAAL